jgi:RNA polymerase sigma-70 factor (ECF subfamily)
MSAHKSLKIFEQIYNETYNNTLKYVICKCNNLSDVDDIIQETYLEFYKVLKSENEILDKQAYIIAIAKNKIIKHFKLNEKIKTISIFQESNEDEFTIDLDSRYRYRVRVYNKR